MLKNTRLQMILMLAAGALLGYGAAAGWIPSFKEATAAAKLAGKEGGDDEAKVAIAKHARAFIEAFHNGDAKALAAFWTPDGDLIDQTGRRLQGRAAIARSLAAQFAEHKGLKLRIESDSLRFVTPDVAV